MTPRKYVPLGTSSAGVVFSVIMAFILPQRADPYIFFHRNEMNCSALCTCREDTLDNTMRQFNHRHFVYMGQKYRSELNYYDTKSEYMAFLGLLAPIINSIVHVTCKLSDGMHHSVMSLLNGVDDFMYTALQVKCQKGEDVIWDVPVWQTSFNVFISEHCNFVSGKEKKDIVIPMNAWIVEIDQGGQNLIQLLDIRFTMNTVSLSISGSKISKLPDDWQGRYMLSSTLINLQQNHLEIFDCPIRFTKKVDTLNLEGNKLTVFPECVLRPQDIGLNYLSLAHNKISDLTPIYEAPESSRVPDIRVINLSHNEIKNVEAIRDMGSLTILDLSHNAIKTITDDAFANLNTLEEIFLSHNRIQEMDAYVFSANLLLNHIDMSSNFLTTVHTSQLPSSSTPLKFDVRNNRLPYPPFHQCPRQDKKILTIAIFAAENPFICDCKMTDFSRCRAWIDSQHQNKTAASKVLSDLDKMKCASPQENTGKELISLNFLEECIVIEDCPAGCSCRLLHCHTITINCTARRLLEMPDTIPHYPNSSIILHLDHNPLQMLSYRSYLHHLTEVYLDNCLLTSVTPAAIYALHNIRVMTLHNNLLQKLPSSTRNITLNHAKNVTLHNNRWACSCDSLWLPRWITKHKSSLWMPGNIVCNYLRKPVEELTEVDLNCNSASYVDTFLALSLALSSIVSTLVIVFCYRSEINVLLYSKLGLRLGYSFSYGDYFHPYDAFISYSQDNYRWVVDTLVPHLENSPQKFRLCLHYRDFPSGEPVVDNIPWAIRLSRCSILVLSKDFLKKEWSIMEVRAAFQRLLLVANRLIIIATDEINVHELSSDLRAYMNTHDYLRVGEPCFWEKLEMFLPPTDQSTTHQDHAIALAGGDCDNMAKNSFSERPNEVTASESTDLTLKHVEMED